MSTSSAKREVNPVDRRRRPRRRHTPAAPVKTGIRSRPGDIATGSCKSTSRRSACGPRGSRLRTHHRRQAHLGSILDRHRSPGPDGSGRAWRCAAAGAFRAPRRPWSDDHLKSDDAAGAQCRSERRAGDRCLTPRPVCPVHTCPDSTSSASNVICRRCMHSRCWSADIGWLVSTELPAVAVPLRPDPVDHPRVRRRAERGGARARLRIHAPGLVAAGVSHRGRTVLAMPVPRPSGSRRQSSASTDATHELIAPPLVRVIDHRRRETSCCSGSVP